MIVNDVKDVESKNLANELIAVENPLVDNNEDRDKKGKEKNVQKLLTPIQ